LEKLGCKRKVGGAGRNLNRRCKKKTEIAKPSSTPSLSSLVTHHPLFFKPSHCAYFFVEEMIVDDENHA